MDSDTVKLVFISVTAALSVLAAIISFKSSKFSRDRKVIQLEDEVAKQNLFIALLHEEIKASKMDRAEKILSRQHEAVTKACIVVSEIDRKASTSNMIHLYHKLPPTHDVAAKFREDIRRSLEEIRVLLSIAAPDLLENTTFCSAMNNVNLFVSCVEQNMIINQNYLKFLSARFPVGKYHLRDPDVSELQKSTSSARNLIYAKAHKIGSDHAKIYERMISKED